MLTTLLVLSVATVLAILITLSRVISLRTITKYSAIVDVTVSIGLMFILAGTAVGAASAIVAGLFLAITLTMLKQWFKLYDKLTAWKIKPMGIKDGIDKYMSKSDAQWTREAYKGQPRKPRAWTIEEINGKEVWTEITA